MLTDAPLWANELQDILADAVEHSFNCLSVEGHASTNDTVLLLRARRRPTRSCRATTSRSLPRMVRSTCETLARAIADDGEGATHFITIDVEGCETFEDARTIARAVADSPLVKTAIHGADPNWGRIVSAAGYSGVSFEEEQLSLWINDVAVYQDGMPVPFDDGGLSQSIKSQRDVHLRLGPEIRYRSRPILDVRPDGGIYPAQCGLHDLNRSYVGNGSNNFSRSSRALSLDFV